MGLSPTLHEMIYADCFELRWHRVIMSALVNPGSRPFLPFPPGFPLSRLLLPSLHNPLGDTSREPGTFLGAAHLQNCLKNGMSQTGKHFALSGLICRGGGEVINSHRLVVTSLSASSHLGSLISSLDWDFYHLWL